MYLADVGSDVRLVDAWENAEGSADAFVYAKGMDEETHACAAQPDGRVPRREEGWGWWRLDQPA